MRLAQLRSDSDKGLVECRGGPKQSASFSGFLTDGSAGQAAAASGSRLKCAALEVCRSSAAVSRKYYRGSRPPGGLRWELRPFSRSLARARARAQPEEAYELNQRIA